LGNSAENTDYPQGAPLNQFALVRWMNNHPQRWRKMRKHFHVVLVLLMALPVLVQAHPAEDLIKKLTIDLIAVLEDPDAGADSELVRDSINADVLPHIDFTLMTKLTVGKHWKTASKEQQQQLVGEFRELLLNTYTKALDEYAGQSLEFLPYRPGQREDRAVVKTLFKDPGASVDIPVDYKLRKKDDWLIYDIEVENISLVLGYRSEFASQIKNNGIAGLISALKAKNAG